MLVMGGACGSCSAARQTWHRPRSRATLGDGSARPGPVVALVPGEGGGEADGVDAGVGDGLSGAGTPTAERKLWAARCSGSGSWPACAAYAVPPSSIATI